ncbi:DUF1285 domain-containing protein [Aureimonas populi]|uniref:DUF1285 domain-containing protein n=1 Tax=Aureimonas populi TaxID=1701758 RepID=A0ABW5CHQ8_9HYPH|nr:DUF1285 domain-containing protein [Aureimonas populi]
MDEENQAGAAHEPGAGLAALLARAERAGRQAPPVERWHPARCGAIDMVIRADGSWMHEGAPIRREALVRLFSSVLRKDEDGTTYLVTPAEMLSITVEDAPFLAVEMNRATRGCEPALTFRTNVGDVVEAGPDHPLRFPAAGGAFRPYLHVRGRLEARLTRPLALELADCIEWEGEAAFIRSRGARFPLPPEAFADHG